MSEYAIEVKGLHKNFRLPTEKSNSLKRSVINFFKGVKGYKIQRILEGIDFKIEKGDFFGIVGRNGSGKSTLLKLLAGIYVPDKGNVKVDGTIVPFIELGVGFNPELTGRENIYLNGALLGFANKEVDEMYDEIVDFAELGEFMDQKLKNYSSGMQVRLAFSIAIKAQGDILILDEVLAVGDESFQRKCNDFFTKIKKDKSKTVILVTHNMDNVRKYCTKAMMLEEGRIIVSGDTDSVASQYTLNNLNPNGSDSNSHQAGLSERISSIKVIPVSKQLLISEDELVFDVEYNTSNTTPTYIGISIANNNVNIIEHNTRDMPTKIKGVHTFRYKYSLDHLNDIKLQVTAAAFDAKTRKLIGFTTESTSCYFNIHNKERRGGWLLHKRGKWKQIK